MSYKSYLNRGTPQTQPAREDQVKNNAGGYVFQVPPLQRLNRFLILGTASNTYYQTQAEITFDNLKEFEDLFATAEPGMKAVDLIVEISTSGRAAKNDPALAALALATVSKSEIVRAYAISKIGEVARIPTHLNHLVAYREAFGGGWGRNFKAAIQSWYNSKDPDNLSFLMAKYQSRDGWSHKDMLRLAHPVPASERHNLLYKWAVGTEGVETFGMVKGLEEMQALAKRMTFHQTGGSEDIVRFFGGSSKDSVIHDAIRLIDAYRMPFEVVPTEFLKEPEIWAHLLPNLGYTSLIRSLARMAQAGFLVSGNGMGIAKTVDRLDNHEALKKARVHPIQLLSALRTYDGGRGIRSSGSWNTVKEVSAALERAFYASFSYVEPTDKRYYVGVDCSGSMGMGEIAGCPGLTPRDAAAVMAMVLTRTEKHSIVRGFTSGRSGPWSRGSGLQTLPLEKGMKLGDVVRAMERVDWGGTDCSLPIRDAEDNKLLVDCFITLTDNETWAGPVHPFQALTQYRKASGIDAKNVVIAFTSSNFTIADPRDVNSLDVAGFDSAAPQIIGDFAKGNI